jgi:glutamate carboxypeptidase
VQIEQHGGVTRAPKPKNAAQHKLSAAVTAVGAALGETIGWKPSGGVCEGNNLFAAGVPNIDTLGVIGGDIHSHNEYAWPASLTTRAQLSALLLAKIASGAVDARHIHSLMTTH